VSKGREKEKGKREKMKVKKTHWQIRVFLALALFSLTAIAGVPVPDIPDAIKGEQCVEDTDFMRRNHMEILLHQRDETVHRGIRTKKHSLKECFTCHVVKDANNQPVTVKNPKHFCRECHDYAAVNVDCFQCHTSVPGKRKTTGAKL
jgi:predicted CXXCH cytochrome family protein